VAGGQNHAITQEGPPATPTCAYQLESGSRSFPAAGGPGSVRVNGTPPGCAGTWSVSGAPDWVQVGNGSGAGSGEFSYTVSQNQGTAPRSATLTVAGQRYQIAQEAPPAPPPPPPVCTYSIDPQSRDVDANGALGAVQVNTGPTCAWSVSGAPEWIRLSTTGGTGPNQVGYLIDRNATGAARTGTVNIAGQTFTVRQQ
jgi:hypothetical protein